MKIPDKKPKFNLFDKVFVDWKALCTPSLITGVAYNQRSDIYMYEIPVMSDGVHNVLQSTKTLSNNLNFGILLGFFIIQILVFSL